MGTPVKPLFLTMMSKPDSFHPCLNDHGELVTITKPSVSTGAETWLDPDATATVSVLDTTALPDELNGIKFAPWTDAPKTQTEWASVSGQTVVDEPVRRYRRVCTPALA
jgi:hypothetical protein